MFESINPYVAVEGSSFTGKSTLIKDLSVGARSCVCVIQEACEYAGGNKNFRRVPFSSQRDAELNIHDFLVWEEQRCADARKLYRQHKLPVVMDRSIYGTLLLQKLLRDCYPEWHNSYVYGLQAVHEAVLSGRIFLPSKLICLELPDEKTFFARTKRGVSVEAFNLPDTWRWMSTHYRLILRIHYGKMSGVVLLSDNGGKPTRMRLVKEALTFLESSVPAKTLSILPDLLNT